MKRLLIIIPVLLLVLLLRLFIDGNTSQVQEQKSCNISPPITITSGNSELIEFKGKKYSINWFIENNPDKIYLYPNFENKFSSDKLFNENICKYLINGGFYTHDDKPLGLFISQGMTFKDYIQNDLIPAIFYITANGKVEITGSTTDNKNIRVALQTGPYIISYEKPVKLTIREDEQARRMFLGITKSNEIIFGTVYDTESPLLGPYLTDFPELISQLNIEKGLNISTALNLDGGKASAFLTPQKELNEMTYIGSFFCIKE